LARAFRRQVLQMDIWQLIARDHAYLAQLITEVRHAIGDGPTRDCDEVLNGFIDELAAHAEALEASLYAPLRQLDRTRQLAENLHREHKQFIGQLDDLARSRLGRSVHRSGIAPDITLIGQHLRHYTRELIPAARELLSSSQVEDAVHAFIRSKIKTLRARQHRRSSHLTAREGLFISLTCVTSVALGYLAGRAASAKRPRRWDLPLIKRASDCCD
jgi:hypothetical protein